MADITERHIITAEEIIDLGWAFRYNDASLLLIFTGVKVMKGTGKKKRMVFEVGIPLTYIDALVSKILKYREKIQSCVQTAFGGLKDG